VTQARKRRIARYKLGAVAACIYLWFGYSLVNEGNYFGLYNDYARAHEIPDDWESHDVILGVLSAHYQKYADPRRVKIDNVSTRVFDTPRTMYLCVFGNRHGKDKPETYQIRVPIRRRMSKDTHWLKRVSHALFLTPDFVDDACETEFRDDVVEVQVQSVDAIRRSDKFGPSTRYSGLDVAAEVRSQGFDVPSRFPSDGLPFVFVYNLENAQHRTPPNPPEYERLLEWPAQYKHVYIGFYHKDRASWRVAGIFHDTGNHVPQSVNGFALKMADATVAPLYLAGGMLVNLLGIRFG